MPGSHSAGRVSRERIIWQSRSRACATQGESPAPSGRGRRSYQTRVPWQAFHRKMTRGSNSILDLRNSVRNSCSNVHLRWCSSWPVMYVMTACLRDSLTLNVHSHAPGKPVATRKCRINCNETLSPPYRLSNGRQSGAAGEVVDARHRGFSFLRGGARRRATIGIFLQRQAAGPSSRRSPR